MRHGYLPYSMATAWHLIKKLLETSHGVGRGRPCAGPCVAIRQGEKVRNVPGKYSFPTSRSRQVNGVMSGAVRVRRIGRLSVETREFGRVFVMFTIIHE